MSHWHFWRLTFDPANIKGNTVEVDLFFARDHFPDVRAATDALASNVVTLYPDAKRLTALAEAVKAIPDHPGSAFHYTTPAGLCATWRLLKCARKCTKTFRNAERDILAAVTEVTGIPSE